MAPPVPIRRIVAALATLSVVAVSAAPVLAHDLLPSEAPTIAPQNTASSLVCGTQAMRR